MHHHALYKLCSSPESVHLKFFISWCFSCQVPNNIFRNAAQYKLTNACIPNYVVVSSCSAKHFFVIVGIPALQWYCQGWFQPWVVAATLIQLHLSLGHLHCIPTFPMLPMSCEMVCNQNIKTTPALHVWRPWGSWLWHYKLQFKVTLSKISKPPKLTCLCPATKYIHVPISGESMSDLFPTTLTILHRSASIPSSSTRSNPSIIQRCLWSFWISPGRCSVYILHFSHSSCQISLLHGAPCSRTHRGCGLWEQSTPSCHRTSVTG